MKNQPLFMQKNFESRTSVIAFKDKVFTVETEFDHLVMEENSINYKYELYSEGKNVAKCYISNSFPDSDQKQSYISTGFKEVPDHYIGLRNITCFFEEYDQLAKKRVQRDYRNNEYASVLLNFVIGDVVDYSKYLGETLTILLEREDKLETLEFYQKFSAKNNSNQYSVLGYTPMIIDSPKQIEIYTGKIISEQYFYPEKSNQLQ